MSRPLLRELRRAVGWHRRLLAAGLAAASVALTISALSPESPASVEVVTAARDLGPGVVLSAEDLASARLPPDAVPAGTQRSAGSVTGRVLAAAVRRGEPLTDVRLVGRPLLAALQADNLVAAPVRFADAASVALLRPGDRVDVLAASSSGPGPPMTSETSTLPPAAVPPRSTVVAEAATVLTVPADRPGGLGGEGALVLLAVRPEVATGLARAAVASRLSYTLRAD